MHEDTWVYLVRHGETDWNLLARFQGQGIVPLNPTGARQAALVAARLAGAGLTSLYSSDSLRAWQTAQSIAAATGLPITPEPRLREVDVGLWQGHSFDEVRLFDRARFGAWQADPLHGRCPEGESKADLLARVEAAFNAITAQHAGGRVALVTHGGPIGAIRYLIHNRAAPELLEPRDGNTSVTLLRGAPGAWQVVFANDTTHLNGAM